MRNTVSFNKILFVIGVPMFLFGGLIVLMNTGVQSTNENFNLAITIDLLLTIPLVYFLLIRNTKIPKTTVVPVLVLGLLIGTVFLPTNAQGYLELFKMWVMPIVEIAVVTFIGVKVKRTLKRYNEVKANSVDFYSALKQVSHEILPKKLVMPFVTEIAVIYYGFVNWKSHKIIENEFTYHKESGSRAMFGVLIFLILIETFVLHLLLVKWNEIVAWVLFVLSVYTVIQILGFAKSLSKRPIKVDDESLKLRYGILSETEILLSDIESVELWTKDIDENEMSQKLSPLGALDSHNIKVSVKKEYQLVGLYGFKKGFETIYFHVDNSILFKEKLENYLNSTST